MKRNFFHAILLGGLAAIGTINLAAQEPTRVKAQVPFEFQAGDKTLPAGEYYFEHQQLPNRIVVQTADRHTVAVLLSQDELKSRPTYDAKVSFRRYGDRNFLYKVTAPGETIVGSLSVGREERKVAAQMKYSQSQLQASLVTR